MDVKRVAETIVGAAYYIEDCVRAIVDSKGPTIAAFIIVLLFLCFFVGGAAEKSPPDHEHRGAA